MTKGHKWKFKARFRRQAYVWHGTAIACKRLQEAVSEIKKVEKTEPVVAAEGVVCLMERLWPATQDIDSSSGALGTTIYHTLHTLIPILINAPAFIILGGFGNSDSNQASTCAYRGPST
jgi:hypothetical protein